LSNEVGGNSLADPAPEPKSYARRFVKGSTIIFTAFIASEITGVFLRMILARSLTIEEYGLFYAVYAFISMFALFRDPGLSTALVKYIPEFTVKKQFAKLKTSIVFSLIFQAAFGLVVSAVLFIFSDYIALAVFRNASVSLIPSASLLLRILSVWFFVESFRGLLSSIAQGFQNIPILALLSSSYTPLIFLLVICFVGILGLGLNGVALSYLLATVLISIFGMIFFIRKYSHVFREKISITKPLVKKLFMFALPVFVAGFGDLILTYTDTLTITIFRTLPEVGYYQAAQPSARILWYVSSSLAVVLFPMVSEFWARRQKKLLRQALHFITKFSFILIIPAALVFIAFPNIVITLLFGSRYLGGVTVLQIFGIAAFIYTLYNLLAITIVGIGRPGTIAKVVGIMAIFNLIGDLLLVPIYGIEGAATTTLASFIIGLVLMLHYARKFIGFTVPTNPLLKALVGGVLTLFLIFGLKSILALPVWPEAIVTIVLAFAFYTAWILATKAITREDLNLIKGIIPMPRWLVRVAEKIIRE
jgi:O-antigen/teichoic acid export membrane protein